MRPAPKRTRKNDPRLQERHRIADRLDDWASNLERHVAAGKEHTPDSLVTHLEYALAAGTYRQLAESLRQGEL